MVFGNCLSSTRFNTTEATATFPSNGSPFASACTSLASSSSSLFEIVSGMMIRSPGSSLLLLVRLIFLSSFSDTANCRAIFKEVSSALTV
jgi:hypothetical protein